MHGNWTQRNLWSLLGAAAWVALEMFRARLLGGFPWNILGASQYQMMPLIQIASITGVYGVSFLVVWVSLSLYSAMRMIFQGRDRASLAGGNFPAAAVVVILFAFGFAQMGEGSPEGLRHCAITLIQPSVPQTLIWDKNENTNRFQQLLQLRIATTKKTLTRPAATLSHPMGEGRN